VALAPLSSRPPAIANPRQAQIGAPLEDAGSSSRSTRHHDFLLETGVPAAGPDTVERQNRQGQDQFPPPRRASGFQPGISPRFWLPV